MEHLKMLRLLSYLLGLLIFPSVQGGIASNSKDQSLCVLQDAPTQCGSFCLATLNPISDNIQKRLDEIEAGQRALNDSFKMTMTITKEDFVNSIQALQNARLDRMEELRTLTITSDANDELKSQVNTLKDTIKDLQSQLEISEGQTKSKEDILKVKEEDLKVRDEQISILTTQIEAIEKIKSELSSQRFELRNIDDKLKISEGQVKIKEDIFKVKEGQIKSQHEHLKNRDEQISDLRTQINSIDNIKSELSSQLSELQKTYDILPDSCPSDSPNGIYQIKLPGLEPFEVPCASSPSGWTVIQRRIDGSENFERNWHDYKSGFGNISGEFFIGLEKLHRMTEARPHELYIKLGMVNGSTSYAHYDDFKIGSEEELYELKNLGKYSGEAGDSLTENEHQKFSTIDRDNDNAIYINCAFSNGAWWHNACSYSTLNGQYSKYGVGEMGIHWSSWHIYEELSLTFVEMMIRPKPL
ncbi:fibrinogen-like protein 1 [Drosophila rhopaloa]|uniref:Fibrinogen-like protein 1 n=1 Tax=Drosophila rhopaloa TaxID=1041015 RepID=A0A6P4EQ19_DRORH|nr:fibrinogen-like protein 1 [Drosophila rhopaloa]